MAVVFGDSFGFAATHYQGIAWFMAQVFREVHFIWIPFGWDAEYVRRVGAEAVLVQGASASSPASRTRASRRRARRGNAAAQAAGRHRARLRLTARLPVHEVSSERAREAIAKQWKWHHRIEVAPGVVTPGLQETPALLAQIGTPED